MSSLFSFLDSNTKAVASSDAAPAPALKTGGEGRRGEQSRRGGEQSRRGGRRQSRRGGRRQSRRQSRRQRGGRR